MKSIIRRIAIYTFALFLLPLIIPGVKISGGLDTLFLGGASLALMFLVLKPILSILSFPINLLTLGMFSILTNALILYLLTIFVTSISIASFVYGKAEIFGFTTPNITLNTFQAYVFTAFVLSVIESFLAWLMD